MLSDTFHEAWRSARTTRLSSAIASDFHEVAHTSRIWKTIGPISPLNQLSGTTSITETGFRKVADTFLLALSNSVIFTTGKQVVDPAIITSRTAWNRAALAGLIEFVEEAVLTSWLYRWLTAEPEPEIIVIDLRETVSVGPLIVLIDRAIGILVPAHQRAAAVRFVGRFYESFLNAPVRVAGFVLFTAVLANLAITFAVGYPTRGWLFVSIFLLTVAGLGTRITITWEELVETRPVRLLISALEPPAITDDEERRR